MNICNKCSGVGAPEGCTSCGTFSYTNSVKEDANIESSKFRIPAYYKINTWESNKLKIGSNEYTNAILEVLDTLVKQVSTGNKIVSSYAIFLPYGHGKKTAMFTIIQKYLQHGYTVAPVIDVASLAILENNFRVKDAGEQWKKMIEADLVFVYGVDFSARYHTMKLFLNLCKMRGLQDRPTILFSENSLEDLRSKYITDNISPENNLKAIGCKLSNPLILDGVPKGSVGQ